MKKLIIIGVFLIATVYFVNNHTLRAYGSPATSQATATVTNTPPTPTIEVSLSFDPTTHGYTQQAQAYSAKDGWVPCSPLACGYFKRSNGQFGLFLQSGGRFIAQSGNYLSNVTYVGDDQRTMLSFEYKGGVENLTFPDPNGSPKPLRLMQITAFGWCPPNAPCAAV